MPPRTVSLVPVLDLSWSRMRAKFETPIGNARTSWSSRETVIVPSELDLNALPPSLRFALDVALHTLQASQAPLATQLVTPDLHARIASKLDVQILLSDVDLQRASDARKEGVFAFKVKVGKPAEVESECTLLRHLRSMGRDVIIRADANSKDLDEALVEALREVQAEYVEDPAPETAAMLRRAGVHVALDELVLRDAEAALDEIHHARATTLVLKPSLIGPLERTFTLAARARARGGHVVLSHAMESTIGLSTLHHIAFAMSATSPRTLTPQGLAPWPGIETFQFTGTGPDHLLRRAHPWANGTIGFRLQENA